MRTLAAIVATTLLALPAFAADVGVSISIGEPDFYGLIDIGDAPRPRLVHAEPILIMEAPSRLIMHPLYLRVPPKHARHWKDHCGAYGACNQRVYFVTDDWYRDDYVPHYRKKHGHGGKDHAKGKDKDKGSKHSD